MLEAVKDANAIIVRSDIIDKEVIESANNLKLIVRAGAGFDNIDINFAKEKNIIVENTPGQNSNAVAELVLGLLVFNARNQFNAKMGYELKGKKIGLLAFGNVAKNVARIAKGFGMEVFAFDAFCSNDDIEKEGVTPVTTADKLFEICDIISLHIPATKDTIKSINYNIVSKLPLNGVIINTARKEIINEEELLKIMSERHDIKFITDIKPTLIEEFEKFEEQFFTTPKKMGAQTLEANKNAGIAAATQIIEYFNNNIIKFQVN